MFLTFAIASLAIGCGGGGGGGSGTGSSGHDIHGIALQSISFPKNMDLTGGEVALQYGVPLTQQVVLTFSNTVEGVVDTNSIQIYSDAGTSYSGPKAVLDDTKNRVMARGTFDVFHNKVVFTPYVPTHPIDLSLNAQPNSIPGLLPGYKYNVYVPLGTTGSIANLVAINPDVKMPENFTTASFKSVYFNFGNLPQEAPKMVSTVPVDGTTDFPVNTYSKLDGFQPFPGIALEFDQPLDFRYDNMEGTDYNNDKVREQNLFLKYSGPDSYALIQGAQSAHAHVYKINRRTGAAEDLGPGNFEGNDLDLDTLLFLDAGRLVGSVGSALYDVDFTQAGECPLSNKRDLPVPVEGLALMGGSDLYGIDTANDNLVRIHADTGDVTTLCPLPMNTGRFVDLAVGFDDALYGLRARSGGGEISTFSVERIDPETGGIVPIIYSLEGNFDAFQFTHGNRMLFFEDVAHHFVSVDLYSPLTAHPVEPVQGLTAGIAMTDFSLMQYELGVTPALVENGYKGSRVEIAPSGILPFDAWVDIMVRNGFAGLSGQSRTTKEGKHGLGAVSVCCFKTMDPGPAAVYDEYVEDFTDNVMEDRFHEMANASALWNVQDTDGMAPTYSGLLASIGLSGAGELGLFKPTGVSPTVFLDTNYQPLPLFDGSTPGISVPTVVTDGEFHFTDIEVPYGVTIMARGSNPLVFTATGSVLIQGTIDVSGADGMKDVTYNSAYLPTPGGTGGPGGGRGGAGQPALPPDFTSLTQLRSVPSGERGWGPGNVDQIGGFGGESGAKGEDVPWVGSLQFPDVWAQDVGSRGAGGGGGSFHEVGKTGYPGWGKYGIDDFGHFFERDPWYFWDGAYEYDPDWELGDSLEGQPRLNEYLISADYMPDNQAPPGGTHGDAVFKDVDEFGDPIEENDFLGTNGEIQVLHGGQGGGGGGSRLNSMNPGALVAAAPLGLSASAFDAKGGGGGGGGGAFAIHSLGPIVVSETGQILATGGKGNGGEVIGHSNFGGGGGGGSGGAIILNSAVSITLAHSPMSNDSYARLDVSGGFGADGRATVLTAKNVNIGPKWPWVEVHETCELKPTGALEHGEKGFCSWSRGDGGYGGYGLIQLMVPDPDTDLDMKIDSVIATISQVETLPLYEKAGILPDHESTVEDFYAYFVWEEGVDPISQKPIPVFPITDKALVDPHKTLSTISPVTYGVSKWIDMGRMRDRAPISGGIAPFFHKTDPEAYFGFRGVELGRLQHIDPEPEWAVVRRTGQGIVLGQDNDISVDSPDIYESDFIDLENNVAIQFQGTRPRLAGSKVPDPDAVSDWTPELSSLEGYEFIRFRVGLNVADNGAVIDHKSLKPQVNHLRLRFAY